MSLQKVQKFEIFTILTSKKNALQGFQPFVGKRALEIF